MVPTEISKLGNVIVSVEACFSDSLFGIKNQEMICKTGDPQTIHVLDADYSELVELVTSDKSLTMSPTDAELRDRNDHYIMNEFTYKLDATSGMLSGF